MISIGNLEIHAWHGCNLACESCSHYSSLGLKGGPSAAECKAWMDGWHRRLKPKVFSIVGGEPTANRELVEIVEAAIRFWPNSQIRLVTNGFLLHRFPQLPQVLSRANNAVLDVTSHHPAPEYQAKFQPVRDLVAQWQQAYDLHVRVGEADRHWTRRYESTDTELTFYDSHPRQAWQVCVGKNCPQIFQGELWKCPPIAYFDMAAQRRQVRPETTALRRRYRALPPDCSPNELDAFLSKEEEEICKICPQKLVRFELPLPLKGSSAATD